MTLKELQPGDVFEHANSKKKKPERFVVYGNAVFNPGHRSATRNCVNSENEIISKSCRLQVNKVGKSVHAEKIKSMFKK